MRHINIPVFIPHEGCKNSCVFCDQRTITGTRLNADRDIRHEIDTALSTVESDAEVEIAFFGGSFTGIDKSLMIRLCDSAFEYVKLGKVKAIRLSTRPDYIDEGILTILKERGVTDIELGLQSMSQKVLDASKRGHTIEDTKRACKLIKQYGFNLVGQMMIGLPCSEPQDEIYTAEAICALGCDGARIYPTVVFYGTELYEMAKSSTYKPLSVEDAVKRSAAVYKIFKNNNIEVLRIGLHSSEELSDNSKVYAGANHPSLGELVIGEYRYELLRDRLYNLKNTLFDTNEDKILCIYCGESELSKFCGQKKINKIRLIKEFENYGVKDIRFIPSPYLNDEKTLFSTENVKTNKRRRKKNCI